MDKYLSKEQHRKITCPSKPILKKTVLISCSRATNQKGKKREDVIIHNSNQDIFLPKGSRKGVLIEKAELLKEKSLAKKKIFDDQRLYFVINFSAPLTVSLIKSTLESLNADITYTYDDKSVKVAVKKVNYDAFIRALEQGRRFIINISEGSDIQKINEKLAKSFSKEHEKLQDLTIEAVDLSGFKSPLVLEAALKNYVVNERGEISLAYVSKQFVIFTGKLYPKTAIEIAEKIETVERVDAIPEITLESGVGNMPYLKNFCDSKNRVFCYDKVTNK